MGFKENLKTELSFQDMIVKELAEKSGVSKHTIDNYLTGHNSIPKADIAVKIANALNVSVEYLVTGKKTSQDYCTKIRNLLTIIEELEDRDIDTLCDLATSLKKRTE